MTSGDRRAPRLAVAVALFALALDAVVIQTVLTEESVIKQVVRVAAIGLVGFSLLIRHVKLPLWYAGALWVTLILAVVRSNPDQLSVLFVLVLTLAATLLDERQLLRYIALASLSALGLIFLFLLAGITSNQLVLLEEGETVVRARQDYGVKSIPFFYNAVFGACALVVLYARKHLGVRAFMVSLAVTVPTSTYFFQQTDVRGGYFSFLLFVALLVVVPMVRATWAYALAPPLLLTASLWLAYFAPYSLNLTLSLRPRFYRLFLEERQWWDFLVSDTVKSVDYPVDNSYIHLLVGGGIITMVLFAVLFGRAVARLMRRREYADVAFLLAVAAYSASESLLVRIESIFVVYAWYLVVRHGGGLRSDAAREDRPSPQLEPIQMVRP